MAVKLWRMVTKVLAPDGAPGGGGSQFETEQQDFISEMLGETPDADAGPEAEQPDVSFDSNSELNLDEEQEGEQEQQVEAQQQEGEQQAANAEPSVEELLRAQVLELTQRLEGGGVQQVYPAAQAQGEQAQQGQQQGQAQAQAPAQNQAQPFTPAQAYLTEEELDQVIDNPQLIVTAITRAQQDVVSQIAQNLPSVISQIVNQQVLVQQAVSEFYDANADLRQYGSFVKHVMSEVEAKNQDKPYSEIFQITADESRKRLGLKKPLVQGQEAQRQSNSDRQRPAFAGSKRGGTTRPAAKTEFFDQAAAEMLN